MSITLRPCSDADIDFLYRLYASTRAEEMAIVDWAESKKEEFLRMQFHAQHTFYHEQFSDAHYDVIEHEGSAIGRLYVDRRDKENEIRIIDIALLPEFRGRGFGKALMQALLNEAKENGQSVTIHVEHNNPAMHLYQRLGFQHIRDEGVYYFMEWKSGSVRQGTEPKQADQEKTAS